eukprot:6141603-Amphidinium_carterae.1
MTILEPSAGTRMRRSELPQSQSVARTLSTLVRCDHNAPLRNCPHLSIVVMVVNDITVITDMLCAAGMSDGSTGWQLQGHIRVMAQSSMVAGGLVATTHHSQVM